MDLKKVVCVLIVLELAGSLVAAQATGSAMDALNTALRYFAGALAVLMFSFQGLRWVLSESPEDRAEAKKGMIYVIVGLIAVYIAANIVCGIYGSVLVDNYRSITSCTFQAAQFNCVCT